MYNTIEDDLRMALAEIVRLNARIENMHAERMTLVEQMNAELDRLRDALADRGAECTSRHESARPRVLCRLILGHAGNHVNGSYEW